MLSDFDHVEIMGKLALMHVSVPWSDHAGLRGNFRVGY